MSESAFEPAPAPAPTLRQIPRRYLALGLIIIAIILLGALVLVRDNAGPTSSSTVETFNPAPSSLIATVAAVPASVYDAVGVSSPANPILPLQRIGGANSPLWGATVDGDPPEPVVFFYGAEFAPYAAAERWPLVLALSRFGTFNKIGVMQSSASTAFADLSTFTFWNVAYSSRWLVLEPVERYSSLNPTGRGISASRPPTPSSPRPSPATGRVQPPSRSSTWPTGSSSTAPLSRPASWPGSRRTRSPATCLCRRAR